MKNCTDCGQNDWKFKRESGMVIVTCKNCKNELRWAAKKKSINRNIPQKCECGNTKFDRVKKEVTIDTLRVPEYYKYYFVCSKCKAESPDITTKKINILYK